MAIDATTVLERGRRKAYRPLPAAARREASRAGVAAYRRGDWFLAHELMEPAWMGSDDASERVLHSALIKLAAAGVHAARGNRTGMTRNLEGARERLVDVGKSDLGRVDPAPGVVEPLDLAGLVAAIDDRLATLRSGGPLGDPPPLRPRSRTP